MWLFFTFMWSGVSSAWIHRFMFFAQFGMFSDITPSNTFSPTFILLSFWALMIQILALIIVHRSLWVCSFFLFYFFSVPQIGQILDVLKFTDSILSSLPLSPSSELCILVIMFLSSLISMFFSVTSTYLLSFSTFLCFPFTWRELLATCSITFVIGSFKVLSRYTSSWFISGSVSLDWLFPLKLWLSWFLV